MDLSLGGRRALVVGGSRGIGRATAELLFEEGCEVTIASRDVASLKRSARELSKGDRRVEVMRLDVLADDASSRVAAHLGNQTLDVLVVTPGGSVRAAFTDLTDEQWLDNYRLNILGTVRVIRAALPALRRGRAPSLILLGAASSKMPYAHQIVSNVHKSGILALVKTLAVELAPEGIRVNAVCPGRTKTDLWNDRAAALAAERGEPESAIFDEFSREIPLGRFGEAAEIAPMVVFLASRATSYVTGQSINVDGGIARGLL